MTKKKRRRGKVIYAFLLTMWGLFLLAGAVYGLGRIWEYAEEYENSRPSRTMDVYTAQLSKNLWGEEIEATVRAMPHEVQSDEEVAEHVKAMLANGISYVRRGGGPGKAIYALRCAGHEFGLVTLVEDTDYVGKIDTEAMPWKLLPWSIQPWKVERESFDFTGLYSSVEIVVPRSFTVLLNGTPLDESHITETGIPLQALDAYYARWGDLPTLVRYRFDNVIGTLTPEILDEDGAPFTIDPSQGDSQFIRPVSGEKFKRLQQFTDGFAANYLKYTSGVVDPQAGYQKLSFYLVIGAELDNRMKDAIDGLTWAHTASVNVDKTELVGAQYLGDHYYMLDIATAATTYTVGKGEAKTESSMRVLVRERNDDIRAICLELY